MKIKNGTYIYSPTIMGIEDGKFVSKSLHENYNTLNGYQFIIKNEDLGNDVNKDNYKQKAKEKYKEVFFLENDLETIELI